MLTLKFRQPQSSVPSTSQSSSLTRPTGLDLRTHQALQLYIYDYCVKHNFMAAANALKQDANIRDENVPFDMPQSFLFEWWSVFWDLFAAKVTKTGSRDAQQYVDFSNMRTQRERMQQQAIQQNMQRLLLQQQQQFFLQQQQQQQQQVQQQQQEQTQSSPSSTLQQIPPPSQQHQPSQPTQPPTSLHQQPSSQTSRSMQSADGGFTNTPQTPTSSHPPQQLVSNISSSPVMVRSSTDQGVPTAQGNDGNIMTHMGTPQMPQQNGFVVNQQMIQQALQDVGLAGRDPGSLTMEENQMFMAQLKKFSQINAQTMQQRASVSGMPGQQFQRPVMQSQQQVQQQAQHQIQQQAQQHHAQMQRAQVRSRNPSHQGDVPVPQVAKRRSSERIDNEPSASPPESKRPRINSVPYTPVMPNANSPAPMNGPTTPGLPMSPGVPGTPSTPNMPVNPMQQFMADPNMNPNQQMLSRGYPINPQSPQNMQSMQNIQQQYLHQLQMRRAMSNPRMNPQQAAMGMMPPNSQGIPQPMPNQMNPQAIAEFQAAMFQRQQQQLQQQQQHLQQQQQQQPQQQQHQQQKQQRLSQSQITAMQMSAGLPPQQQQYIMMQMAQAAANGNNLQPQSPMANAQMIRERQNSGGNAVVPDMRSPDTSGPHSGNINPQANAATMANERFAMSNQQMAIKRQQSQMLAQQHQQIALQKQIANAQHPSPQQSQQQSQPQQQPHLGQSRQPPHPQGQPQEEKKGAKQNRKASFNTSHGQDQQKYDRLPNEPPQNTSPTKNIASVPNAPNLDRANANPSVANNATNFAAANPALKLSSVEDLDRLMMGEGDFSDIFTGGDDSNGLGEVDIFGSGGGFLANMAGMGGNGSQFSGSDKLPLQLYADLAGHSNKVNACAFSFDGKWLASAGLDKKVLIWSVQEKSIRFTLEGHHSQQITAVRFSPDERHLLITASHDRSIRLWDLGTALKSGAPTVACLAVFTGNAEIKAVDFCPIARSDTFISLDAEGELKVWNVITAKCVKTIRMSSTTKSGFPANPLRFRPLSSTVVAAAFATTLSIVDINTCKDESIAAENTTTRIISAPHLKNITSIDWSADGTYLVTSSDDIICVWETTHYKIVNQYQPQTGKISSCAFLGGGASGSPRVAFGDYEVIYVWNFEGAGQTGGKMAGSQEGTDPIPVPQAQTGVVAALACSSSGDESGRHFLASGSMAKSNNTKIWIV
ncbi:uncharacterized protein VTP21DRAFT_8712 [Calcarisporiella thermophila]|uniref:uncharacterized protein n=1 Tax=Calcarisporiella thermophila TaxID=911321 RepID=UPI0037425BB2